MSNNSPPSEKPPEEPDEGTELAICFQRSGCNNDFIALYEFWDTKLRYSLRNKGAPSHKIDDICQEVWVKVFKNISNWSFDTCRFSTYLFYQARYRFLDSLKSGKSLTAQSSNVLPLDDLNSELSAKESHSLDKAVDTLFKTLPVVTPSNEIYSSLVQAFTTPREISPMLLEAYLAGEVDWKEVVQGTNHTVDEIRQAWCRFRHELLILVESLTQLFEAEVNIEYTDFDDLEKRRELCDKLSENFEVEATEIQAPEGASKIFAKFLCNCAVAKRYNELRSTLDSQFHIGIAPIEFSN